MSSIDLGQFRIGPNQPLTIIAGPCLAESRQLCVDVAGAVGERCAALGFSYIFKASFDKANRSSIHSERGPGLEAGLAMLEAVRDELGLAVTTDVHEPGQPAEVAAVVDLLQVPAFLCRQTDLLAACAHTGKPVNVKKGQFMAPAEMSQVVTKLIEARAQHAPQADANTQTVPTTAADDEGSPNTGHPVNTGQRSGPPPHHAEVMLTERGTFFGYHRLVNDFLGLGDLMALGPPVCFDVTHSSQAPGAQGKSSGGRPDRGPLLARCAVAAGVEALFIETHPEPAKAKSDAATMLDLSTMLELLSTLSPLRQAVISSN